MNKIVYVLKAYKDYEVLIIPEPLRPPTAPSYIFSTKKKANEFFDKYCWGTGLIQVMRCINDKKFKEGLEVNEEDLHADYWNKRK